MAKIARQGKQGVSTNNELESRRLFYDFLKTGQGSALAGIIILSILTIILTVIGCFSEKEIPVQLLLGAIAALGGYFAGDKK